MKIGYRWFVRFGCEVYEPQEHTYSTFDEVKSAMQEYLADGEIPLSACGIDMVEDDDGCIEVLECIIAPTTIYYED